MRRRHAFTLIELLIVVVIVAILAVAVIPQFMDSTADAKRGTALANLRTLRGQIQVYKVQHRGAPPTSLLIAKLTEETDADGAAGTEFGPYLQSIAVNPFTNKNTVTAATSNPQAAASSGADRGWLYHAASYLDSLR